MHRASARAQRQPLLKCSSRELHLSGRQEELVSQSQSQSCSGSCKCQGYPHWCGIHGKAGRAGIYGWEGELVWQFSPWRCGFNLHL